MTKNNWFTTNLKDRTANNLCDFQMTINPYEFEHRDFYVNCNIVAKELSDKHDKLYVSYSGGIDSEFVLKTFVDMDLPITPIIIDTPFNKHETHYAFKFCQYRNIKPEVMTFSKNDIVDKLYEKSIGRGFFSLLGGLPLMTCDAVNQVGGKLITGYGEPFTTNPGAQPHHHISTRLEFCEWDYYLDAYDDSHPSGFFTYDLGLFYSLVDQIRYDCSTQRAKYELYKVEPRFKLFWLKEFYEIFREIRPNVGYDNFIHKNTLFEELNKYKRN